MEILKGEIQTNELTKNAMGGTELLAYQLQRRVPKGLLKEFQIISSRVRNLDESCIRIFWAHDLPGDPESEFLKYKVEQDKFHLFVFVSNWQMQAYINHYRLPWSKCLVMENAIESIPEHTKPDHKETLRLTYFSTPHRGLNILVPVFAKLCEKYDNLELDVFSSFKLYGWESRDEHYKELFDFCRNHPKINYYGAVDNGVLRESLTQAHILAYPSTWQETSCLVLMEAMSAGLLAVHSNLAALPETSAKNTVIYQYQDAPQDHANLFYHVLDGVIADYGSERQTALCKMAKTHADMYYNWEHRAIEWENLLKNMVSKVTDRSLPKGEVFSYST